MKNVFRATVDEECIRDGEVGDPQRCPVAMAIKRHADVEPLNKLRGWYTPKQTIYVRPSVTFIQRARNTEDEVKLKNDDTLRKWVIAFDSKKPVEPIDIEVNLDTGAITTL